MKDIFFINNKDILNNAEIKNIVTKIKNENIQINNLSYFHKKMIELYLETENHEKEMELQRKKNLILHNKLKNSNEKNKILSRISDKDREMYFEFLKNMKKTKKL